MVVTAAMVRLDTSTAVDVSDAKRCCSYVLYTASSSARMCCNYVSSAEQHRSDQCNLSRLPPRTAAQKRHSSQEAVRLWCNRCGQVPKQRSARWGQHVTTLTARKAANIDVLARVLPHHRNDPHRPVTC